MNGAKFKTIRQLMGFKIEWTASTLEVQPRSIQRWELKNEPVPEMAAKFIETQYDLFKHKVKNGSEAYYVEQHVRLYRYINSESLYINDPTMAGLPESFHGAIIGQITLNLEAQGHVTHIEWV